jgi:hypothetical protein
MDRPSYERQVDQRSDPSRPSGDDLAESTSRPRPAVPRENTNQTPGGDRCAEHNLAAGPTGECVLCRRERSEPAAPARWLSPLLLAAGLGTALLCGLVLGRRQAPPPPVAEATAMATAAMAQPVEDPIEEGPVALAAEPLPRELPALPVPAPTHVTPQRDYLGEAYAAMRKSDLYGDAPAHSAPAQPGPSALPAPRPHGGMGHGRSGGGRR